MKPLIKATVLVCLVVIFLSIWALPAATSKATSAGEQDIQGHISLTTDAKGNIPTVPDVRGRGIGELDAIAAISASDIWAVGDGLGTLIEHWNGSQWSLVKSPSPGAAFNNLYGIAAVSANDVWAVGSYSNDPQNQDVQTLIEHWNGSQWSLVKSPSPGSGFNRLNGVAVVSANNVWAVGGSDYSTLIEHWNGTQWSVVSSPTPDNDAILNAVTALSAGNVWAVGYSYTSSGFMTGSRPQSGSAGTATLVEQWNGTQWSVIPSPNSASSQYNDLTGIAAVSATDMWAVGNVNNFSQTLIEQWNGAAWSIIPSPNPGSSNDFLNAVAVVSANNVWAVGGQESGTSSQQTLIEQWNGAQWSVVSSPNVGTETNRLNGVVAISSGDAWVTGFAAQGAGYQTVNEQWNGTKWSVVSSPNRIGAGALSGVATLSASDIWAVGADDRGTLTEHWNGTKWSFVTSPSPGSVGTLSGVAAITSNNVWAVGYYFNSSTVPQTLIEQWNGTKWSVVNSPDSSTSQSNYLTGVAAISASNIWAVGYSIDDTGINQALIEHWNGSSWSIVPGLNPGAQGNSLNAVTAISASNVWAVGYSYNSSYIQQTLIEHWNGTTWKVVSSPSPGSFQSILTGVTAISGSTILAVGSYNGASNTQTLVEQWNGTTWSVVASPNAAAGASSLSAVAAVSASNVWAVGNSGIVNGYYQTLIEHWNGQKWKIVTSSNPGSLGNVLTAVTVVSASNAWTVGQDSSGQNASTLVEHWNGSAWSVIASPNVITSPIP